MFATLIGNALEFYDFLTYTFLAIYIGKAFFPTDSSFVSLLLSVGTFGIGFLTRPLGGILIGAYADRVGRKPALLLTIVLMSVGTIGLVATPSYATIGIAAPLILIFARLVQGFALGGEVGLHGPCPNITWTHGCVAMDVEQIERLYDLLDIGDGVTISP